MECFIIECGVWKVDTQYAQGNMWWPLEEPFVNRSFCQTLYPTSRNSNGLWKWIYSLIYVNCQCTSSLKIKTIKSWRPCQVLNEKYRYRHNSKRARQTQAVRGGNPWVHHSCNYLFNVWNLCYNINVLKVMEHPNYITFYFFMSCLFCRQEQIELCMPQISNAANDQLPNSATIGDLVISNLLQTSIFKLQLYWVTTVLW